MTTDIMDNKKYEALNFKIVNSGIVLMLLVLISVHQVLRQLPLIAGIAVMGVFPLLLGWFYWRKIADWSWFLWVKTYSVTFLCCALFFGKFTQGSFLTGVGVFIYVLIMINVLEASLKDFLKGSKINTIAGLLVAVSTPLWHGLYSNAAQTDLFYNAHLIWIFAYTVWNITFIYGEGSEILGQHTALLMAPLVLAIFYGSDIWVQARVMTLGSYFLVYNSNRPWFKLRFVTSSWRSEQVYKIMQITSIVLAVAAACSFYFF